MWTTSPCLATTGKRAWAPPLCWPWSTRPSAGGAEYISLEVRPSNRPAVGLYTKLGFLEEGRRRNFYNDPTEDALILTRRFQKEGKA